MDACTTLPPAVPPVMASSTAPEVPAPPPPPPQPTFDEEGAVCGPASASADENKRRPKKPNFKWDAEMSISLLESAVRVGKGEIKAKDIPKDFARRVHVDAANIPTQSTLSNKITDLKRAAMQAHDLQEEIGSMNRTTTQSESFREKLSSRQQDLEKQFSVFHISQADEGHHAQEVRVLKLGNELKLNKTYKKSAKDLEDERKDLKKQKDEMTIKLLENPEYRREVRRNRRSRPSESNDGSDEEAATVSDQPSKRHKMAYCDPDDPAWSGRRSRDLLFGSAGEAYSEAFGDVRRGIEKALVEKDNAMSERLNCIQDDIKEMKGHFDKMQAQMAAHNRQLMQLLSNIVPAKSFDGEPATNPFDSLM